MNRKYDMKKVRIKTKRCSLKRYKWIIRAVADKKSRIAVAPNTALGKSFVPALLDVSAKVAQVKLAQYTITHTAC